MCTQQTASGMSDPALLAGRFLNRYPAMKYVQTLADGQSRVLNIALVGCAPELEKLRNAFFNTIFSSVHMLDVQLHIHILSEDASTYYQKLTGLITGKDNNMPLLSGTTRISLDGHLDNTPLDSRVVYEPLAHLHFHTAHDNWTTLFSDVFSSWDCGYVLMFDPIFQQTAMKDALSAHFSSKTALLGFEEQAFDGAWHSLPPSPEPDILDQAKKVHVYYSRTFNPREDCKSIDDEFAKVYSRNSSIRCALSIPYKLAACGIFTRGKDAAMEFHRKALSDTTLLDKLSWLEHRSWQAYMITQGFDLLDPSDTANWDKLYRLPKPKNRIETTALKKHPCLHASVIGSPPIDWKTLDTANLDPLDRISVELYNLCDQRAKDLTFKTERDNEFKTFRDKVPSAHQPLVYELGIVMERMFAQEPNINKMWQRLCRELESKKDITSDAKKCLEDVKTSMGIVEARNQQKDYKTIDTELIQAIPYLEIQESVQTIYKIHSPTVWKNVISSLHIAPKKLYLVILSGDPTDAVYQNHKEWCQKLLTKRGLTETVVEVVSIDAVTPDREGSIVDVTGNSADTLIALFSYSLSTLPMIQCENGKLDSRNFKEIQFFTRPIELTVEESLAISGAKVFAAAYEDPLLMMTKDECTRLWNIVGSQPKYNECVSVLTDQLIDNAKNRFVHKLKVDKTDQDAACEHTVHSSGQDLCAMGLRDIMEQLKQLSMITTYSITPSKVKFSGNKEDFNTSLENFIKKYSRSSAPHVRYELVVEANHQRPDTPAIFLQRANLSASISVPIENDHILKGGKPLMETSVIEAFLESLEPAPPSTELHLIHNLETPAGSTFTATFNFASKAVRSCLIKAGNALEAFAYHTIASSNLFDDVKLSVNVLWGKSESTTNEIDVICTRGIHTYMISCKQRPKVQKDMLHEINDHASQFGVCPTTILLTTADPNSTPEVWERAKNMGVHAIFLKKNYAYDSHHLIEKLEEIIEETTKTT